MMLTVLPILVLSAIAAMALTTATESLTSVTEYLAKTKDVLLVAKDLLLVAKDILLVMKDILTVAKDIFMIAKGSFQGWVQETTSQPWEQLPLPQYREILLSKLLFLPTTTIK